MPRIETDDGVALHHVIDGPDGAPPLLFSNSLGSNLTMWDREAEALADRFRVIRYDARGHGHSGVPEGEYSMDRLANDALALLDALGVQRADFVGLSMGGMVGMWLASRHPDRIGRLVLCNTAAGLPPRELWQGRIDTALSQGMEPLADPTIERWFTAPFRADPANAATLARIRAMVAGTPAKGYAGCCAAIRDMDQRETIGDIRAETLVLTGREDPATPPEAAAFIAGRVPGARLEIIEGCAHVSNIERPDDFHRIVVPFLAGG